MMLSTRRGFTLIELLVVAVILGVLAALAVPRYARNRTKTFYAAMQSDLRHLAAAEEIYFSAHDYSYAGAVGSAAETAPGLDFAPSQGVGVTMRAVASTGWSAEATHAGLDYSTQKCAMFFGNAPTLAPATRPGLIACIGENQ